MSGFHAERVKACTARGHVRHYNWICPVATNRGHGHFPSLMLTLFKLIFGKHRGKINDFRQIFAKLNIQTSVIQNTNTGAKYEIET